MQHFFDRIRGRAGSTRAPQDAAAAATVNGNDNGNGNGDSNLTVVNVNVADSDDDDGTLGGGGGGSTSQSILTSLPRFPKPWGSRPKSVQQQQQPQQQQPQQQSVPAARPGSRQTVMSKLNHLIGRGGGGDDDDRFPSGYGTRAKAAAVILKEAARLPLTRRHELLAAVAATLPELAPLFQLGPVAATGPAPSPVPPPVPAVDPVTGCLRQAPGPTSDLDLDVDPAELRDKVRKLVDKVKRGPAAEPSGCPLERPAGEGAADSGEEEEEEGSEGAADALSVSVVPEYEQYGILEEEVRAVISLKAIPEVPNRAQVALTCVLDRSGSMSGERIRLVRETCHFLIDQLSDQDYLGLVSYAGEVREDLPLLRMTPPSRALAHAAVEALHASGSTALYDGLVAGVRQQMEAEVALREGGGGGKKGGRGKAAGGDDASRLVHSCFLFTDGQATDGPSTSAEIISSLQAVQAPTGQHVTVHTFGFGSGHSVELLQQVAEAQSGVYYYISCTDDIACGFGDALGGLLAVVATSVRLEVRTRPGVTLTAFRSGGRVLHSASPYSPASTASTSAARGRTARQAPGGGGAAAVPTGATFNDMFAEESRECLLVLRMPPAAAAAAADAVAVSELVEVALQYTDVARGQRVARDAVLRVQRSSAPRPAGQLPAEVVFVTAARFETVDAIEAAQLAAATGPPGDVSGAHKVLDEQLLKLTTSPLLQVKAVSALVEQTRAARISIKPRAMMDQSSCADVATTVQALKQQRLATGTMSTKPCLEQYDYKCKSSVRQTARAFVGSSAYGGGGPSGSKAAPPPPKGSSS